MSLGTASSFSPLSLNSGWSPTELENINLHLGSREKSWFKYRKSEEKKDLTNITSESQKPSTGYITGNHTNKPQEYKGYTMIYHREGMWDKVGLWKSQQRKEIDF